MKNATATSHGSRRLLATDLPGEAATALEGPDDVIDP
jgi:hypothetical protein